MGDEEYSHPINTNADEGYTPAQYLLDADAALERDQDADIDSLLPTEDKAIESMTPEEFYELIEMVATHASPRYMQDHLPAMAERFASSIRELGNKEGRDSIDTDIAWCIGEHVATTLARLAAFPESQVPSDLLRQLYDHIHSPNGILRDAAIESVDSLIALDRKNKDTGEASDLDRTFKQEVISQFRNIEIMDPEVLEHMVTVLYNTRPMGDFADCMVEVLSHCTASQQAQIAFGMFSGWLGEEKAFKILEERGESDARFAEKARLVLDYYTGGHQAYDSGGLYEVFDIGQHAPSQELLEYDGDIIYDVMEGKKRVLDIGCGVGNHIQLLRGRGLQVDGVDKAVRNVVRAQTKNPDATIMQGDMRHLPVHDASYEGAYCIGRTASHNTPQEMLSFFLEVARVLGPDGKFVVDYSAPDLGYVGAARAEHERKSEGIGSVNREFGSYYGSPDRTNFTLRFVPTDEQVNGLAALAGFDAKIIRVQEYVDHNQMQNKNVYWEFTKRREPLTFEEMSEAHAQAFQSGPPVDITIPRF